jgi:hypothetical protein
VQRFQPVGAGAHAAPALARRVRRVLLSLFLNRQNTLFDLPEADKCLLAFGELDVQCSMFDVHFLVNPSYETSQGQSFF